MARHLGRPRPAHRPPRRPRVTVVLVALVASVTLAAVAAGCGTSGRSMEEPAPGATAPPRRTASTTTTVAPNALIQSGLFSMTSPSWSPGGEIPADYTCDGSGVSPPLTWGNVPDGTAELVLVVTDPDADGFIHWMVVNIDPTTTAIQAGEVPPGSVQLTSTDGQAAYAPLCPPSGPSHTYEFALYALGSPSGLTAQADTRAAVAQVVSNQSSTALVTGTYARTTAN